MSYGTLYRAQSEDFFSQAVEVLIQERDYSGAVTDIKGTDNPVSITFDTPNDFILSPINGSFATLRLMTSTDFQFADLHTSDARKYQVLINIAGSLYWKGFILPGQFQQEYRQAPNTNVFTAADQLGYLKTLVWDVTDESLTLLSALEYILDKTDLDLDMYEGLNIYEDNHDDTTADSPLDQTWFNANVYKDKTYYEALYDILFKFEAIIKQDTAKWVIYRPRDAKAAYYRRLWTWDGSSYYTYDSNAEFDPIVSTTSAKVAKADLVRIVNGASVWTNEAWKGYNFTQNYGKRDNMLLNGDFSGEWNGGKPESWVPIGGIEVYTSRVGNGIGLSSVLASSSAAWTQLVLTTSDRFKLTIEYDLWSNVTVDVEFAFRLDAPPMSVRWYDFDNNVWSASTKRYSKTYAAGNYSDSLSMVTSNSGLANISNVFLYIYPPVSSLGSLTVKNVSIQVLKELSVTEVEEYPEDREQSIEINPDNNYQGLALEVLCADNRIEDAKNIYYGSLFKDSTKLDPTILWNYGEIRQSLVHHLQAGISEMLRDPQQVLSGSIISNKISSSTVIREVNYAFRLFIIKRATFDIRFGRWTVEAHQIAIGEDLTLDAETGSALKTEVGGDLFT